MQVAAHGRSLNSPLPDTLARFDAAMARFGPFEKRPHLAVAVSGGSDSLALCLLADGWARARGGRVTALTVDHGLRPESAEEAHWIASRLAEMGIAHETLRWTGQKPATGIQATARDARYRLMRKWCASAGVLHLLTGHQADDQAETRAMRSARALESVGAAGISACLEYPEVRLLRPLLNSSREELRQYLIGLNESWIDDPSNQDPRFERVRTRRRLGDAAHVASERLGADGPSRQRRERAAHAFLASAASLHPLGFARLDPSAIAGVEPSVAALGLGRLVACIGGRVYGPSLNKVSGLVGRLSGPGFRGATLGGCRFDRAGDGELTVFRESRNLPDPLSVHPGTSLPHWDGRFRLDLNSGLPDGLTLAPLGRQGWAQLPKDLRKSIGLPLSAASAMPALFHGDGLHWCPMTDQAEVEWAFYPKIPLSFTGFCIA